MFWERASSSRAVALASSKNEVSEEDVDVGERGGGCRVRGRVLFGVTGVLAPDVGLLGSLESTEVKGCPNIPVSPPADNRSKGRHDVINLP